MTGLISGCVGSNQLSDYCENKLMNERKPHTTEVRVSKVFTEHTHLSLHKCQMPIKRAKQLLQCFREVIYIGSKSAVQNQKLKIK